MQDTSEILWEVDLKEGQKTGGLKRGSEKMEYIWLLENRRYKDGKAGPTEIINTKEFEMSYGNILLWELSKSHTYTYTKGV